MSSVHGKTHILLQLLILLPPFKTIDVTTVKQERSAQDSTDLIDRAGTSEISTENPVLNNSDLTTVTTSTSFTSSYTKQWLSNVPNYACGNHPRLPANSSVECDPTGGRPCCNKVWSFCDNEGYSYCTCEDCVDYRIVQDLRNSDTNCAITRVGDFLKTVCSDVDDKTDYYFRCINSDMYLKPLNKMKKYAKKASNICDDDKFAYQSCVYRSQISNNYKTGNALCGGCSCVDEKIRQSL